MNNNATAAAGSTMQPQTSHNRKSDGGRRVRLAGLFAVAFALALTLGVALDGTAALADAPPVVTIDAPTAVSYTSAHVSGTVNPKGGPSTTTWHFEYSTEPSNEFAWNYAFLANGEITGPAATATTPISVEGNLEAVYEVDALTPGTQYWVRLVAENESGTNRVVTQPPYPSFTTLPVAPPTASISAPTSVTGISAHFSGQVDPHAPAGNPHAFDVIWHFECTPECPGLSEHTIPADNSSHTVEADAGGLLYNTSYEVKLVAGNAGGSVSPATTFKTEAVAPQAETRPVGTYTDTTALIGGSVDPRGSATTYTIEYANDPAFTSPLSTPATTGASAGAGQPPVVVSQLITGLQPSSTYYFRITATNAVGTTTSTTQAFQTRSSSAGAPACANEQLRIENNSLALPDCRAYELVSPDLNHAQLNPQLGGRTADDGDTIAFETADAPDSAQSAGPLGNFVRAKRDPARGWSGTSLEAPLPAPIDEYISFLHAGLSADFSSIGVWSNQPLSGGSATNGKNLFVGGPGGVYHRLTTIPGGEGVLAGGNADYSHVYFYPPLAQLPSDPLAGGNLYSWSEAEGLKLVGILPDGTIAPAGATLEGNIIEAMSADANRAVFMSEGKLYLHIEDARSVEVSASQRTIEPDPNPGPGLVEIAENDPPLAAGITSDGSTVLFVARSELTNDADTGSSGGVATDAGANLYSYDVQSGHLTDLTVDANPADAATGAGVKQVLGATADGSYIYFTATGELAPGAVPGQASLYVWHNGTITFIADAEGLGHAGVPQLDVSANGQHAVFASTESLTGYDNIDPVTGQPHWEVFEANLGAGIECASCRPNGTSPTADTAMPSGVQGQIRVVSDDGSRVFFQTADAVLPRTSNGEQKVFEYSQGKVSLISSPESSSTAAILATTPSGDDVFFDTFDELVPNPNGGDDAVYDARVGGGFPVSSRPECSGAACRGPLGSAPVFGAPASSSFSGAGNLSAPAPKAPAKPKAKAKTKAQIRAEKLAKALKVCKAKHNKKQRSACEKKARHNYGRSK